MNKTTQQTHIMNNKHILPLLSLLLASFVSAQDNLPPHYCSFEPEITTNHISNPSIKVGAMSVGGLCKITESGVEISVSANAESVSSGDHEIKKRNVCRYCVLTDGVVYPPTPLYLSPDTFVSEWTFAGQTHTANSYQFDERVTVSAPGNYTLTAKFTGTHSVCTGCFCEIQDSKDFTVYKFAATCDPWFGLDRRDGFSNAAKNAESTITPGAPSAQYSWSKLGVCTLVDPTSDANVWYTVTDKESASSSYLNDRLEVTAKITSSSKEVSISATTNLTVVMVDVTIGGLDETKEETEGACLEYKADDQGNLTDEGKTAFIAVSIECLPTDLPSTEMVKIEAPEGFLYEKVGVEYTLAQTSYKACEVAQKQFFLHGHNTSEGLRDVSIIVTHENSGAKDMAKCTVFEVRTETEVMTPDNRNRRTVGLGEEVDIRIYPSINCFWQVISGNGTLMKKEGSENTYIAPDKEDVSMIEIKSEEGVVPAFIVKFNTIPPSNIIFKNVPDKGNFSLPPAYSWVDMKYRANYYLQPDSVNFYKIKTHEGEAAPICGGNYSTAFPQAFPQSPHTANLDHPMSDVVEVGRGTKAIEVDCITFPAIDIVSGVSGGMYGEIYWHYAEYYSVGIANQNLSRIKYVIQKLSLSFDNSLKVTVVGTKDESGWKQKEGEAEATPVYP